MTIEEIIQKISTMDNTYVTITFMEGDMMRVYAIQDCATSPYIDCIIPTEKLSKELSKLDTVDELDCIYED